MSARRTRGLTFAAVAGGLVALWYWTYLTGHGFGLLDWDKDGYALAYLKQSLTHFGSPPRSFLAVSEELRAYPTLQHSVSYWANPEMPSFSPLLIPLRWMALDEFWRFYFLAHILVGCGGTYLLAVRMRLGLVGAAAALVLVVLNPWLIQHVAIGYTPWVSACYAPMIIALLVGPRFRAREAGLAAALDALIVYEGGLHVFIWLNAAVVLLTVVHWARHRAREPARRVAVLLVGTGLLAMPKLVAGAMAYGGLRLGLLGSYASPADLWGLLTDDRTDLYTIPAAYDAYGTNLYDGSTYVGIAFLVAAAWAAARVLRGERRTGVPLLAAAVVAVVLGWEGVWKLVTGVVPWLETERYPYRFLIVAVFLVAFVIAMELDALAAGGRWRGLVAALILVVVAVPLASRARHFGEVASGHPLRFGPRAATVLDDIHKLSLQAAGPGTRAEVSPAGVSVWPAPGTSFGSCIPVPWLLAQYADDFRASGGALIPDRVANTVKLCPRPPGGKMTIEARSYGRTPLTLLMLLAFGGYLLVLGRSSSGHTPWRSK